MESQHLNPRDRLASILQSGLLVVANLRTKITSVTCKLTVNGISFILLDAGQLVLSCGLDDFSSAIGDLVCLALDSWDGFTDALEGGGLRVTNRCAQVRSTTGKLSVDRVTVGLDWVGNSRQAGCIQDPGRAIRDLVGLALGLGTLLWRWWWGLTASRGGGAGAGARDGSRSVVLGVLNAVADTIVSAAEDRVAGAALTGELTASLRATD